MGFGELTNFFIGSGISSVDADNKDIISRNVASTNGEIPSSDSTGELSRDVALPQVDLSGDVESSGTEAAAKKASEDEVNYGQLATAGANILQSYFQGKELVENAQADAAQLREQGAYLKEQADVEAQKIVDDERFAAAQDQVDAANTGFFQAGDYGRGGFGQVLKGNKARADISASRARQRGQRAQDMYNRLADAQEAAARRKRNIGVGRSIGKTLGFGLGAVLGGPGGAALGATAGSALGGYAGKEF